MPLDLGSEFQAITYGNQIVSHSVISTSVRSTRPAGSSPSNLVENPLEPRFDQRTQTYRYTRHRQPTPPHECSWWSEAHQRECRRSNITRYSSWTGQALPWEKVPRILWLYKYTRGDRPHLLLFVCVNGRSFAVTSTLDLHIFLHSFQKCSFTSTRQRLCWLPWAMPKFMSLPRFSSFNLLCCSSLPGEWA